MSKRKRRLARRLQSTSNIMTTTNYSAVSANGEDILSRGGSLADALRICVAIEDLASFDAEPVSVRVHDDAAPMAATIAPKK